MANALPREAYALLDAIAKSESAGAWNVIYGGSTFDDYSKHPAKYVTIKSGPNKGDVSSAAGKYQITKSTYDRVAPLLGITDFTPESQLRIAYYLAQEADPQLAEHLASGDTAAISRALNKVWTSLPGGIEQGQSSSQFARNYSHALASGVRPPGSMPGDAQSALESIHDRNAEAQGYSLLPPSVGSGRPAYFNETGLPPTPQTRSPIPALSGVDTATGLSLTPRITDTDAEAAARRPTLDWAEFRPSVTAGGLGSLLDDSLSPSAENPVKAPVSGLRLPTLPTTITGRPDAPIGSLPAAESSSLLSLITGRPSTPVGSLPAASSSASLSAPTSGLTAAQRNAIASLGTQDASIVRTGQGIAGTAELPSTYRPPASAIPSTSTSSRSSSSSDGGTLAAPTSGLTAAQRNAIADVPLSSYVRPLTTSTPLTSTPAASSTPTTTTVTRTIANPDYAAWEAKYGDGSQVQTAPTGGYITANQLAAISGSGAPTPLARPASIPAAPPRTITITTTVPVTGGVATLPGTVPGAQPVPRAQTLGTMLSDWWARTPAGRLGNLLTGQPQAPYSGLLGLLMGDRSLGSGSTSSTSAAPSTVKRVNGITPVDVVKAATGMSSAQAYNYLASQNNSRSGTTSSGAPLTKSDGSSWAA